MKKAPIKPKDAKTTKTTTKENSDEKSNIGPCEMDMDEGSRDEQCGTPPSHEASESYHPMIAEAGAPTQQPTERRLWSARRTLFRSTRSGKGREN
jgi:hypothetical protein